MIGKSLAFLAIALHGVDPRANALTSEVRLHLPLVPGQLSEIETGGPRLGLTDSHAPASRQLLTDSASESSQYTITLADGKTFNCFYTNDYCGPGTGTELTGQVMRNLTLNAALCASSEEGPFSAIGATVFAAGSKLFLVVRPTTDTTTCRSVGTLEDGEYAEIASSPLVFTDMEQTGFCKVNSATEYIVLASVGGLASLILGATCAVKILNARRNAAHAAAVAAIAMAVAPVIAPVNPAEGG